MKLAVEEVAEVCHEANRAYCKALGDRVLPAWGQLSLGQQRTTIRGVQDALADPDQSPRESHVNWMHEKLRDGWTYGATTNDEKKTHICLVPYDNLPPTQRAKDALFLSIIRSLQSLT